MRKIFGLLTLSLLIMTTSSTCACSCEERKFSQDDKKHLIARFIINKLGIHDSDLVNINETVSEEFLTNLQKLSLAIDKNECELGCSLRMNEKSQYQVNYRNEAGKNCVRMLEVIMKSNVMNDGFKGKVKTLGRATCS